MKNITIIVIVLVCAGLIAWAFRNSFSSTSLQNDMSLSVSSTTETVRVTTPTKTQTSGKSTNAFDTYFGHAGNYTCSIEQVNATVQSSNTVYVSSGKMYGEFHTKDLTTSKANNQNMFFDGTNLYVWVEGYATGVKTPSFSLTDLARVFPKNIQGGTVLGSSSNNVSWDCHPWVPDVKKLVVPKGVTFTAVSTYQP